jgi:hypothetical protein
MKLLFLMDFFTKVSVLWCQKLNSIKSAPNFVHGRDGISWGLSGSFVFAFRNLLQILQFEMKCWMSLFMLHQKRISRARCLVFTIPRCDSCNFTNISRCRVFCLYNYEFGLSLCKIVRSSVILLLPLYNNDELIDDEFDVSLVETQLPISSAKLAEFKNSTAVDDNLCKLVRGRSRWFNADHDRGQILIFITIADDRGSVAHNEQMYFINLRVQSISVV